MVADADVFLHIGVPRTASRTFQYHYFTEHDEIVHVGKKQPHPSEREQEFIEVVTDMERWELNSGWTQVEDQYLSALFEAGERYVVSAEAFCSGSTLTGKVDRYTIAERLREMFPNGEIVVVLRNQLDVLRSMYRQRLEMDPGTEPFREWIKTLRETSFRTTTFDYLNYHDLLRIHADQFGFENVNVLFFEELLRDTERFVRQFSDALGVTPRPELLDDEHENPGLTSVHLLWRRAQDAVPALGHVPAYLPEGLKHRVKTAGSKIDPTYTDEQSEYLRERFGRSNRALRSEFDLPVGEYGYPVAEG